MGEQLPERRRGQIELPLMLMTVTIRSTLRFNKVRFTAVKRVLS